MSSFSNISIVGNLTRDPEIFLFKESGRKKTTMTVAVNNWSKNKNNEVEKTADFYKVETWDNLAQLTKDYLSKGSQVAVSGRLHMENWKDKEGKSRVTPTVKASQIALPQKGKPPEASVLSRTEHINEKVEQAVSAEEEEFTPDEFPPISPSPNGQLASAQLFQGNANDESNEDSDDLNQPDVEFEISENSDFSDIGSQPPEEIPKPAQFGQTMKVVETTIPSPPTIASIARSA